MQHKYDWSGEKHSDVGGARSAHAQPQHYFAHPYNWRSIVGTVCNEFTRSAFRKTCNYVITHCAQYYNIRCIHFIQGSVDGNMGQHSVKHAIT